MELIKINQLKVKVAEVQLFQIESLGINSRQKVGLIGDNGVGKTTLMKLIAGEANFSELVKVTGSIARAGNCSYVPQLLDAANQSGGQREKLTISEATAKLRNAANALLLLDEPTSNLDFQQQKWLINLIKGLKSACLIISHDQAFLNQVCDTIWCIKKGQVITFKGTYAEFEENQQKQRARAETKYAEQARHLQHLKTSFNQHLNKAKSFNRKKGEISSSDWRSKSMGKVNTANNVIRSSKILSNRIEKEEKALIKPEVQKQITLKNGLAKMTDLAISPKSKALRLEPQQIVAYQQQLFAFDQEVELKYQAKAVLTGKNGAGKSVFLSQIKNRQLSGFYHPKLQIGYFSQNIIKSQSNETLLQSIMRTSIFNDEAVMQILADLHLWPKRYQQINSLSGGQLVCFNLAKIITGKYNLLLLDEPTNFLDIAAINALAEFINAYPYAVITVSHDQAFVDHLKAQRWTIAQQQLLTKPGQAKQPPAGKRNELELLKFQRDKLMLDPAAALTEIKQLSAKIQKLEGEV